ncbi:hypothetical protein GQ473_03005 [archaeon]|nr:hypothetical protein [archaeon]
MKDDILNSLTLTLEVDDEQIEIPIQSGSRIEFGDGINLTAEELRQIADLSEQFAIWIKQMRNYSR